MHYRLTDAVADPPGEPACHTEELVRLPGGFCCYALTPDAPPVAPSPADATGCVTLGSLHKLAKLNGAVLDLWSEVLRVLPTARLLIFRDSLMGGVRAALAQQLARRGIQPERLLLRNAVK